MDKMTEDEGKSRHRLPKFTALYGAGAITGAGIATGSKATQSVVKYAGGTLKDWYNILKKRYLSSNEKLIEFRAPIIPPGSRYPLPVLESSWKKWKKPSRRTLVNIMRGSEFVTGRNPKIVFRDLHKLSAKLDSLIEFGGPVPFRYSLGKRSTTEASIKARKAIIAKLGKEKPETFESLKQWPPLTRRKRNLTPIGRYSDFSSNDGLIEFQTEVLIKHPKIFEGLTDEQKKAMWLQMHKRALEASKRPPDARIYPRQLSSKLDDLIEFKLYQPTEKERKKKALTFHSAKAKSLIT